MKDLSELFSKEVRELYCKNDYGHNVIHATAVHRLAQTFAKEIGLDDMTTKAAEVAALYHDIGLIHGRDMHHIHGAEMFKDTQAFRWCVHNGIDVDVVIKAILNHRSSTCDECLDIVSKIVADADTSSAGFDIELMLNRSTSTDMDEAYMHFNKKFGHGGYAWDRLHTDVCRNMFSKEISHVKEVCSDKEKFETYFHKIHGL